jgi:glycosyltransferase involved in cell wall biosynthesis
MALKALRALWRERVARRVPYPFVRNVNDARERRSRGFALLEYDAKAFMLAPGHRLFRNHQKLVRCQHMAAGLGALGYVVDVGHRHAQGFRPRRNYDLIISDRQDWRGLDWALRPGTVRVFLANALEHSQHAANLQRRHARLAERRGCALEMRRIFSSAVPALAHSHALVGSGNNLTLNSWRAAFSGPIYPYSNFGYRDTVPPAPAAKDFEVARRHFLFYASRSQMQKGLDLLLEIFPQRPDLHLHICSDFKNEPDFCACYHKELFETPNIHPIGWTTINSPQFYELAARCACVIHPTCSEGQAGSVVQCMSAGLTPLVTREAGLDTGDFGLTFADDSLEEIARVVGDVAARPAGWHRRQSAATLRVAQTQYSEDAFQARWGEILREITGWS